MGVQNCINCATNYRSGYGYKNQNSINSITTRCYRFESSLTITAASTAISYCLADSGRLTPIRNTMEYALIDGKILSNIEYLVFFFNIFV